MAKFTKQQIESELAALENTESRAAVHYLKQELRRREGAGRKATSKLTRKEQLREAQQRFRDKAKTTPP